MSLKIRADKRQPSMVIPARASEHIPMQALLLVFGDLETHTGVIRGDAVFDGLMATSSWLVTRLPNKMDVNNVVALVYQNKVGFRAAARVSAATSATIADAAAAGLAHATFLRIALRVAETEVFRRPLPMGPLVNDLSFVSNKRYWGHALRSSPRIIPINDFEIILKLARLLKAL